MYWRGHIWTVQIETVVTEGYLLAAEYEDLQGFAALDSWGWWTRVLVDPRGNADFFVVQLA